MSQRAFVQRRSGAWEQLDALCALARKRGVRRLSGEQLTQLGRLYRWVTSDLAFAQGREFDSALILHLNRLTARAHALVYGGNVESGWDRIATFFSSTFPCEFRRSFAFIAICISITAVSAIIAYAIIAAHPADAYSLLPKAMIPGHIAKSLHDSNFAISPQTSSQMAAEIITNNVKVAFIAAGGGITLGLATLWVILQNGLMLGGVGALYTNAGFGYDFWATVAPHGVIELTAIQVAGAAGLLIGAGVLYPGNLHRRDALIQNARRAGILVAGAAAMLLCAGMIEGFFSPLRFPPEIRIAVGASTTVILLLYFSLAGHSRVHRRRSKTTVQLDIASISRARCEEPAKAFYS
ncbi:MAG: stage II sporulation protein M [Candidatus Eremiobacteraeota bacterium]|nr:stage II sporulation protein M [Candidatus Eremiobacteraeota bacterium]